MPLRISLPSYCDKTLRALLRENEGRLVIALELPACDDLTASRESRNSYGLLVWLRTESWRVAALTRSLPSGRRMTCPT